MAVPKELKGLRFPCECVSAKLGGYSDPWADVTKRKLLPNGTKEEILNLVASEPKTISQIAEALNLSAPSVHTHINEMTKSELVRESEGPWRRFLDEVVAMGYKLEITEFDVNDKTAPSDIAIRDRMVADYAKAYLDVMLSYPQLRDILAWGMVDRYNWLEGFDPRADKMPKRGTPYDSNFRPKPLREAIAASFMGATPA